MWQEHSFVCLWIVWSTRSDILVPTRNFPQNFKHRIQFINRGLFAESGQVSWGILKQSNLRSQSLVKAQEISNPIVWLLIPLQCKHKIFRICPTSAQISLMWFQEWLCWEVSVPTIKMQEPPSPSYGLYTQTWVQLNGPSFIPELSTETHGVVEGCLLRINFFAEAQTKEPKVNKVWCNMGFVLWILLVVFGDTDFCLSGFHVMECTWGLDWT